MITGLVTGTAVIVELYHTVNFVYDAYTRVSGATDLFCSKQELTLEDVKREITSSNSLYFERNNLPILLDRRNSFYDVIQPSIPKAVLIKRIDLLSGGKLYQIYKDLKHIGKDVNDALLKLDSLFTSGERHPDYLLRFLRIFTEAYTVLLHVQCVYSHLHRLEIGCTSLDAPELKSDTLQTRRYLNHAIEGLSRLHKATQAKRLGMISITKSYLGFGYDDRYMPLSTSTEDSKLLHVKPTTKQPANHPHPEAWYNTKSPSHSRNLSEKKARQGLDVRAAQVCYMFDLLGGDNALMAVKKWKSLRNCMEDRLVKQTKEAGVAGRFISKSFRPIHPRVLLPYREKMCSQTRRILSCETKFEVLEAVWETSIVRIEWVKISGPPASTSRDAGQAIAAGNTWSENLQTSVTWDDHVRLQSDTMQSIQSFVVPQLKLEDISKIYFKEMIVKGGVAVPRDFRGHQYKGVYFLKTSVWFFHRMRGVASMLWNSEEPLGREVEWELHTDKIVASNDEFLGTGRFSQDIDNGDSDTLQRSVYKRRNLRECSERCKRTLYKEFGILAEP